MDHPIYVQKSCQKELWNCFENWILTLPDQMVAKGLKNQEELFQGPMCHPIGLIKSENKMRPLLKPPF